MTNYELVARAMQVYDIGDERSRSRCCSSAPDAPIPIPDGFVKDICIEKSLDILPRKHANAWLDEEGLLS